MAQTAGEAEEQPNFRTRRRTDRQWREKCRCNTEVLGYVEGFTTDLHRRPATSAQADPAFFELLGAVETRKLYTWAQADPAVQVEALTRLREYHGTLDIDHQRLWKEWLDKQLAKAANDKTGRKDFLNRLTAFVT